MIADQCMDNTLDMHGIAAPCAAIRLLESVVGLTLSLLGILQFSITCIALLATKDLMAAEPTILSEYCILGKKGRHARL